MRSERAAALAFALARTVLCAYRAATQSIVHDEALTFNWFLSGTWRNLYKQYDANNHLLSSMLSKLSMSLLGRSEFALRLPSVIAGFFFMWGVWRVLEFAESRAVRWSAYAAIGLYPLMLDFAAAARGYGLALALLAWALYWAMMRRSVASGLLLGLAVGANFTAAFPAVGCIAAVFLLEEAPFIPRLSSAAAISLTAAATAFAICGGMLKAAHLSNFYVGAPTIHDSLFSLVYSGILATPRAGLFGTWAAANLLAFRILPAVGIFITLGSLWAWRRRKRRILVVPMALAIAAAGMVAAHRAFGVNYPVDRTGLALALLFALAWALVAGTTPGKLLRGANVLAGCLLAIQFATQFHVSYFSIWMYDRSTKEIARRIAADCKALPPGSASVGATWIFQPALEYYRKRYRITALRPVERRDPTPLSGQDYYVLDAQDATPAALSGRAVLFSDPAAGVVLAKAASPGSPSAQP